MTIPASRVPGEEPVEVLLLGRGRHVHRRKGGCLMELVSTTAGRLWTDRPG